MEGSEITAEPFKVYSSNWPTLTIFWATWNQWQQISTGPNQVRTGFDWAQVLAALKLAGIKRAEWPMIFEGLRAIETEALEWLNPD